MARAQKLHPLNTVISPPVYRFDVLELPMPNSEPDPQGLPTAIDHCACDELRRGHSQGFRTRCSSTLRKTRYTFQDSGDNFSNAANLPLESLSATRVGVTQRPFAGQYAMELMPFFIRISTWWKMTSTFPNNLPIQQTLFMKRRLFAERQRTPATLRRSTAPSEVPRRHRHLSILKESL